MCCKNNRSTKDQNEPVDDNTQGEKSVAEAKKEHEGDMILAKANIIIRQADEDAKSMEVSQTKEAVKDD